MHRCFVAYPEDWKSFQHSQADTGRGDLCIAANVVKFWGEKKTWYILRNYLAPELHCFWFDRDTQLSHLFSCQTNARHAAIFTP
ncbi:hypothetical protein FKM82_028216 [Ascaphus truei]